MHLTPAMYPPPTTHTCLAVDLVQLCSGQEIQCCACLSLASDQESVDAGSDQGPVLCTWHQPCPILSTDGMGGDSVTSLAQMRPVPVFQREQAGLWDARTSPHHRERLPSGPEPKGS